VRDKLETFKAAAGTMKGAVRHKPHLLFTWLNDLIRHPRILDAVGDITGPNILCWGSSFFIEARNQSYVSWHQDSTYWGFGAGGYLHRLGGVFRQQCSEWGDTRDPRLAQDGAGATPRTFAADNPLSRGQEIMVDVDERQVLCGDASENTSALLVICPPADERIASSSVASTSSQVAGSNERLSGGEGGTIRQKAKIPDFPCILGIMCGQTCVVFCVVKTDKEHARIPCPPPQSPSR
jgi:hypothetical protein